MHEMSVAISIVQSVCEIAADPGDGGVATVNIRVGAMSGVIPEALTFAWTPATRGTPLEGTALQIEFVPAAVHCLRCEQEVELPGPRLVCPRCQTRASTLVRGRELELLSLEIHDEPNPALPRILEVRTQILKKNDELARDLRERFRASNCYVVSLVSSPGTGKTEFLKQTLVRLREAGRFRLAALVGDLRTDHDAARLAESGVEVRQIETGTMCHLEADMVERAIDEAAWDLDDLDLLFVENVGNLVCPSGFDLGEDLRLVLVSTTEGEDKPLKYPTIFNTADVSIITKMDLAEVLEFDGAKMKESIQDVRPGMETFEVSAKTGQGMAGWIEWLSRRPAVK